MTIKDIINKKNKQKITVLTAYDYITATILDEAGIDIIMIGDSVGNVNLGYETTVPVTMDEMIMHTKAVKRGVKNALIVADMPFLSYQTGINDAVKNAGLLIKAGAHAVKLEGGKNFSDVIEKLVKTGIPVMGHAGLLPQSVNKEGGYFIKGKTEDETKIVWEDALTIEKAGAFSTVLECVVPELAKKITDELKIPTIGIGSGKECDGQVLVINDLLGFSVRPIPKFAKPKINLRNIITEEVLTYIRDVKENKR